MRRITLALLAASGVLAAAPGARAGMEIVSKPKNLHVQFEGPVIVKGDTPLSLESLPPGSYAMRVHGLGSAAARGRLYATAAGGIRAERWAGPAAILAPPGYVHMLRDDAKRGLLLLGAEAAGVTMALVQESSRQNASDDLDAAKKLYASAVSDAAIAVANIAVQRASREEADEATVRNYWIGYGAAVWAGAAVEAWLMTAHATLQTQPGGGYLLGVPDVSAWKAGLISAVLPGSGQRYAGRGARGSLFSFAVLGFAAGTIVAYDQYLEAIRDEDTARRLLVASTTVSEEEIAQRARDLEQAAEHTSDMSFLRWAFLGTTGAMWAWNVLDATEIGRNAEKQAGVRLSLVPRPDGVRAEFAWRWQ